MLVLKVLFFILVLFGSEKGLASARRCFGCVSLRLCETGQEFARMFYKDLLPDSYRQTFINAICGYDDSDPIIPKVCCSDFPDLPTLEPGSLTYLFVDPIETHRNVGLLPTSCGNIDGTRIVGGRYAKLYEFPWMALIANREVVWAIDDGVLIPIDDKNYNCGGTVINSRYILTAAHCVINTRTLKYKNIIEVRIGEWDVTTETDCQGAYQNMICETKIQDIEVDEIIPHEDFTGQQPVENDIALLRLKRPIEMENNAAPICLPIYSDLRSMNLTAMRGTVAGWGDTENSTSSYTLKKVDVPIKSGDECNFYYDWFNTTTDKVFCAGAIDRDSCNGDSGGPLMIETNFNGSIRMVQFGIVSSGPRKCGSILPGIYTDVTKYMDWILNNIRE